ncbi:NAD(P)-dependent oxidoreductase [Cryomorphaceae bacterium 1068]|nr:NAD(P)-dependent oxidoreductase [Cryomorphaceae bacterium 1068]
MTKIGIIREGKTPPDKRVPLTPAQCKLLMEKHSDIEILVETSPIRAFKDDEYRSEGIEVVEDLSECSILLGVKEVPFDMLIPNRTYFFFSHTYKKQPYNRDLLRTILDKKIRLIDYEVLTDEKGRRLIGFGRYAGIVGAYNALLAAGKKFQRYDLKPAYECEDRKEVERELKKIDLPNGFKTVITGKGRVAGGAMEILDSAGIRKVSPKAFLEQTFSEPVYTQLGVQDYNKTKDGSEFKKSDFYSFPERFDSDFAKYSEVADMYISCHYWDSNAPFIFTREDAKEDSFNLKVVADISCDIDGPVASTLEPSTIADPLYGYDPSEEEVTDFMDEAAIGVMAVDNLPCELPKDASEDFGQELINNIFPELLENKNSSVIRRATQTNLEGSLTTEFEYLQDYVEGKE